MRAVIYTLTFFVLALAGFFATPGLFRVLNPEYQLALRTLDGPLTKVRSDLVAVNAKIFESDSEIAILEKKLREIGDLSAAKGAELTVANATPEDIAKHTTAFAMQGASVSRDLTFARNARQRLEEQRRGLEKSQADMMAKIEASQADSTNLYLVVRALALGAIGALMSMFAKFLSMTAPRNVFDDNVTLTKTGASMAMGGIVAVVVVGMFFTGFISIFPQSSQPTGTPDFWKVTILCLVAGAFSDRLFQAASGRLDQYLNRENDRGVAQPDAHAAPPPRPGS